MHDEVEEAHDVDDEDGEEHEVEDVLPGLGTARGVILGLDRCVEGLVLWILQRSDGCRVVPIVYEGAIQRRHEEGAAG